MRDRIYYIAVSDGVTYDALVTAFGGVGGGGTRQILSNDKSNGACIVIETGLDTSELAATSQNKTNYITTNGLQETSFDIVADARFISTVYGPSANSRFATSIGTGDPDVNISLVPSSPSGDDPTTPHGRIAGIKAINNAVIYRINDQRADTATSAIKGPRASVTAINFDLKAIPDSAFRNLGQTGQTITGATGTYRYIDTLIKVVSSIGLVDQLPLRIIQKE